MTTESSERDAFSYGVAREERVPAMFVWCALAILSIGFSEMAVIVFVDDKRLETTIVACIALCASLMALLALSVLVKRGGANG